MSAICVLGAQWGDEGKGKLTDILSSHVKACCRSQGGNNAGHTIQRDGITYDFHLLPSGLASPTCLINLVGSGCVVHIPSFFAELEALKNKGLNTTGRVFLSNRAHVVSDLHQLADGLDEVELGAGNIGTTKKGIGPTYSTKMSRSGIRVVDLFDSAELEKRLRRLAVNFGKRYGAIPGYNVETELTQLKEYSKKLRPFVVDEVPLLRQLRKDQTDMLVEGANAIMLDVDFGTYPFVTSSNTGTAGLLTGLSLGRSAIKEVIGCVKAYTTRVGSGPFPTEQLNQIGEKLQQEGREWGVTTGRKRRCGWLDLVQVQFSHDVNEYTSINVTKLDVLDTFEEIRVATEYYDGGKRLESFPAEIAVLERLKCRYETFPGWMTSTTEATTFEQLPENARKYLLFIEDFVGVKVKWIGIGELLYSVAQLLVERLRVHNHIFKLTSSSALQGPGRENMIAR